MTINCSKCSQPLNAVECVACAQPVEILPPLLAVDPTEHALLLALAAGAIAWRNDPIYQHERALDPVIDALIAFREANHA